MPENPSRHIDNRDYFLVGHAGGPDHAQHTDAPAITFIWRSHNTAIRQRIVAGLFANKDADYLCLNALIKQIQEIMLFKK